MMSVQDDGESNPSDPILQELLPAHFGYLAADRATSISIVSRSVRSHDW